MKKNKLIELLQNIKGNPEVMFYNGFVDDVVHIIKPVEDRLHRLKAKWVKNFLENEGNKYEKPQKWNFTTTDYFDDKDLYEYKRIIVLEAKKMGKSTFDRVGTIEY